MKTLRPLVFGALVAPLFGLSTRDALGADGDYEHRDDLTLAVVSCEEAYTRLQSCCPDFVAAGAFDENRSPCLDYEWRKTTSGCGGPTSVDTGDTEPLALSESECIRALSCDELRSSGVCERAKNDPTVANTTGRPAKRGICP